MGSDDGSTAGRETAVGSANNLEFRSRLAAGDRRAAVIAATPQPDLRKGFTRVVEACGKDADQSTVAVRVQ